ncbi:MAG: hypothetical protein ACYTX0_19425 [Nostoc sp.]
MSNSSVDDFICLPKDICIFNTLAMGVAIQILAKITGETIGEWKHYIGKKAEEQQRQLSAKEIQEIIEKLKSL